MTWQRVSNFVADDLAKISGMKWVMQLNKIIQACLASLMCSSLLAAPGHSRMGLDTTAEVLRRPIAVADIIQLARVITPGGSQIDRRSPDGRRFVILLSKGNIENNTNEYFLELFRTADVMQSPKPRIVASLSSSSNRPAIQDVKWINDHSIAFLGERPGEEQQLYVADADSGEITRMTDERTSLTAYAIGPNGDTFYIADNPVLPMLDDTTRRNGIIVSNQALPDLISLRDQLHAAENSKLFMKRQGEKDALLVQAEGINAFSSYSPPPMFSPDGRYLIVKCMVTGAPPAEWNEYQDRWIQREVQQRQPVVALYRFELVDTKSLHIHVLLDAPTGYAHSDVLWAADSRSVVISGTYLPLNGTQGSERRARQTKRFTAEISVPDGDVSPVTDEEVTLDQWNANTGTIRGRLGVPNGPAVQYQKTGGHWQRVGLKDDDVKLGRGVEISVEEDPNTPPKLYARDVKSGTKSLLLDPNPQLSRFQLGKVEEIAFKSGSGATAEGTLYFPVEYTVGKKYPLIIQTHADDLSKFMIDGPYTTAFAAQPLSGKGFFVAQLKEDPLRIRTPHEVTDEAATYETVIDYLDARGLIQSNRVGIIAFSRTGLAVGYALTHSHRRFAAAILADISDAGYFRYVAMLNRWDTGWDSELANEAAPFGKGLATWLKNCPGFNLDKVSTPVRLEANEPGSLFFEWEWFAVLSYLGKPVELLYLPDADHVLVKPANRIASQQGTVDWFCFWLKDEEDHDPGKAEEYSRWRKLREQPIQQIR